MEALEVVEEVPEKQEVEVVEVHNSTQCEEGLQEWIQEQFKKMILML